MVVAAGESIPMESLQRSPKAAPSTGSPDRSSVHCCERSSPVKNRKREICTSGTVRGGDGNILTYSAVGPIGRATSELGQQRRIHDVREPIAHPSAAEAPGQES